MTGKYQTVGEIILELIIPEMGNTLYMLFFTTIFSLFFGVLIAAVMMYTKKDGLHPNWLCHGFLEISVDVFMSFPFVVLAVALIPFTRLLIGTSVGKTAAIVPLTVATTAVFSKFIYDALLDVNEWMVEAAKSFGASGFQIIKIMFREALPAIVSGTTLSIITTMGPAAMMGALGAGGIGAVAVLYGFKRNNQLVMLVVVVVLVIFTQLIQMAGEFVYKHWR